MSKEALKLAHDALRIVRFCVPPAQRPTVEKAMQALEEALAQPEQEPVATLDDLEQEIYENTRQFVSRDVMEWMLKRYYTTPPQRTAAKGEDTKTWVGLTNDEVNNLAAGCHLGNSVQDAIYKAAAKLKEKNT